jgi:hypothetical protein
MPISSTKLVHMAIHRYQFQCGPNDLTNFVKDIRKNINVSPKKLDINGKVIPSRICHKGTQNSKEKCYGSIKKGCRV